MTTSLRRVPISGAQVVGVLVAMVVATAVLPPAAARALNSARIAETQNRANAAAAQWRTGAEDLPAAHPGRDVLCGPGRLPDLVPSRWSARTAAQALPSHGAWLLGAVVAPEAFNSGMPTDAWGRCFLLNLNAGARGGTVWLLSAGPNALVETPLDAPTLAGDDIGARVR